MPIYLPQNASQTLLDMNLAGHLDDAGFAWGQGTNWRVQTATGLFTMALRTNDIQRGAADGSSWGNDYLDVKACLMTIRANPKESGLSYMTLVNEARTGLTRTKGTTGRNIWWDGLGLMMIGRVRASDIQLQTGQTYIDVALQFTAADGLLYEATLNSATMSALGGSNGGFNVSMNVPLNFSLSATPSSVVCYNNGTENAYPTITLNGPAVNPAITNLTTGQTIKVPISLIAGQYVNITTGPDTPTILFMGSSIVIEDPTTSWWTLPPGESIIQYSSDSYDASASAQIQWRGTSA